MPKYSIIVPVYNCEKELPSCVESILRQTLPDFELLLIDDGSPDRSGALCEAFARKDDRIRVFHKRNGGAASARNYGIEHALGDYLLFIDGDDTIAENSLEMLEAVASPQTMAIFGIRFDYYHKNRLVRSEDLSCRFAGEHTVEALAAAFHGFFRDNQLSSACNKVFDRALISRQALRFNEEMILYEDFDFVARYLQHVRQVFCVGLPLYHYRNHLDRPHINRRIQDLTVVRRNLRQLNLSLDALYASFPSEEIPCVETELYIGLLQQHLLQKKSLQARQLAAELPAYCSEESFQKALDRGAKLTDPQQKLLELIRQQNFSAVAGEYRKKRIGIRVRRLIKRAVRRY